MEPKQTIAFGLASKSRVFPGSSSDDLDLMEGSASSSSGSSPGQSKRKRSQVPHDVMSTDGEDDPDGIVGDNISDHKNKQPVAYAEDWQNKTKDVLATELIGSSTYKASKDDVTLLDIPGSSDLDLINFNNSDGYEDDEFDFVEDDNVDFAYENHLTDNDLNSSLAAKLDDLDLPPGVEASVSWLQKHDVRSTRGKKENIDDEIEQKYKAFKQFDTVQDSSDHYFASSKSDEGGTSVVKKPPKEWAKRIQSEWKVLEKDLPENIFVRVYEDRMDLLRAVIIGPAGTPYHDGLFFFDICFPSNYPHSPPLAHYHSGGLRINPNLYCCGKVCLSLLNTWPGNGCEKWNPSSSTMLQVLVSIQALVLNATPYFNEPGYEQYANSPHGERLSNTYNEETFLHSCKTMLYTMRRPPLHFEVFVSGYFREKGRAILAACRAYMQGAKVGNNPNLDVLPDASSDISSPSSKLLDVFSEVSSPSSFKRVLKSIFEELLMEFTVKGADCNEFLVQKAKAGLAKGPDTSLKL